MARKRKLRTSPSCQGEGICSESGIDRFSVLPDEVAHHILSFLKFKDLTRVGAVSKRCRQFHLSVPVVDFGSDCGGYFWRPRTSTNQYRARLMSSFDRYLLERGHNRLQRFHVSWKFFTTQSVKKLCDDDYRVHTWIQSAVRCNVEELHLDFENTVSSFPSCIFRSQSLRSLSVNYRGIFEAPSLSFSSNLHYLSLTSVRIEDERVFQWISCCCKCIKELHLYYINAMKSVAIESSSLESFSVSSRDESVHLSISGEKLENIDIGRGAYASLKIFAPNLKNLNWNCYLMKSQNPGEFMNLEEVRIFLPDRENVFDKVFEVLHSICSAKVLVIDDKAIEPLSKEGSMPAPIFDNLCNLSIHCANLNDYLVPGMVSLLRGMPNLTTLYIKKTRPIPLYEPITSTGFGMEYWKLQNLVFIHQLEDVTIENLHGSNEIEFARYILENAQNLKKMVIVVRDEDEQEKVVEGMVSTSKKVCTATVLIQH